MITLKQVSKKNKKKVDSFKIKEWKKHDKENNYVYKEKKFRFAAYNGEDVIGNAYGNTNGGVAYLDGLIVSKKYRNRGIGKMLLKKFLIMLKKKNLPLRLYRKNILTPPIVTFLKSGENGRLKKILSLKLMNSLLSAKKNAFLLLVILNGTLPISRRIRLWANG